MAIRLKGGVRHFWRDAGAALVAAVLATAALVQPARADDPLLQEATAFFGQILHIETGVPAVVVAVVRGDDTAIIGFGDVGDGSGRAPDGKTLMRIGSITKVFTGEVLAGLTADGMVALTDPLQKHLVPSRRVLE